MESAQEAVQQMATKIEESVEAVGLKDNPSPTDTQGTGEQQLKEEKDGKETVQAQDSAQSSKSSTCPSIYQVGSHKVFSRSFNNGLQLLDALQRLMMERVAIDKDYSRKLVTWSSTWIKENLNKFSYGTHNDILNEMLDTELEQGKQLLESSNELENQIDKLVELKKFLNQKHLILRKPKLDAEIETLQTRWKDCLLKYEKHKENLQKLHHTKEIVEEESTKETDSETVMKEQEEYARVYRKTLALENTYREQIKAFCEKCKGLEEQRILKIVDVLNAFQEVTIDNEAAQARKEKLDGVDEKKDANEFILKFLHEDGVEWPSKEQELKYFAKPTASGNEQR